MTYDICSHINIDQHLNIIKFTIKETQMRNIRGNSYGYSRQTQKFTLSTLLDFYEANPQENYIIAINNNLLKTVIESSNSNHYLNGQSPIISNQSSINYSGVDQMAKKTAGLFSNLIHQMKSHKENIPEDSSEPPKKKQYDFYYKCFEDASPRRRGTSTKKVKERALGIAQDSNFKRIELPYAQKKNENSNYLNTQTYNCKQEKKIDKNSKTPFIDLDFSFQEMNFEEHDKNNKDDRIQIKIVDMAKISENGNKTQHQSRSMKEDLDKIIPQQEKESISLPKPLIPMAISKQVSDKNSQGFLQIPYKERKEVQSSKLKKLNQLCINTQSQEEDFRVQGTKKVESRIYQQSLKASKQKDIEIDFDLDLNFI